MEWSPHRDNHNLEPPLRKFADVSLGRIHRYAGQTVVELVPLPH